MLAVVIRVAILVVMVVVIGMVIGMVISLLDILQPGPMLIHYIPRLIPKLDGIMVRLGLQWSAHKCSLFQAQR